MARCFDEVRWKITCLCAWSKLTHIYLYTKWIVRRRGAYESLIREFDGIIGWKAIGEPANGYEVKIKDGRKVTVDQLLKPKTHSMISNFYQLALSLV